MPWDGSMWNNRKKNGRPLKGLPFSRKTGFMPGPLFPKFFNSGEFQKPIPQKRKWALGPTFFPPLLGIGPKIGKRESFQAFRGSDYFGLILRPDFFSVIGFFNRFWASDGRGPRKENFLSAKRQGPFLGNSGGGTRKTAWN